MQCMPLSILYLLSRMSPSCMFDFGTPGVIKKNPVMLLVLMRLLRSHINKSLVLALLVCYGFLKTKHGSSVCSRKLHCCSWCRWNRYSRTQETHRLTQGSGCFTSSDKRGLRSHACHPGDQTDLPDASRYLN